MSQGRKELRRLQIARESANGTRFATPRALWRGVGEMPEDARTIEKVEEQVGIFGGTDRTYTPKLLGQIELAETEATFEQITVPLLLLGLGTSGGGWQGSAQGASGSAVVNTLIIPAAQSYPYPSVTIEAGDDAEAEFLTYVIAEETTLTFSGGEAMKVSSTLKGRSVDRTNASGSFSAVGTLYPVETILASAGTFWLVPGTTGNSFGQGQVTAGNILAGEITLTTMWALKYPVDSGTTYFHTAVFAGMEITGELTLEHQVSGTFGAAGTFGQKAKWKAEEPQLLQATWRGGTIPVGTGFSNKELTLQLPIKWDTFNALDDMDGNDIVVGEFTSRYNEYVPAAGRGTIRVITWGTSPFFGAV